MAGVFAVGASLGVEWMSTKAKIREDSAISVVWALGMAIGTLFIFLTPGYVPELSSFLFGNILTITRADLMAFAIYAAVLIAFFALRFRTVIACTFDRDFARTINLPVVAVNYIMTILVALCIVLTIRLIGIMLLMSMFPTVQGHNAHFGGSEHCVQHNRPRCRFLYRCTGVGYNSNHSGRGFCRFPAVQRT